MTASDPGQEMYPQPGPPVPGTDPAGPSECAGFRLNHTMYRITNPERSMAFYRDVLGFRRVMTLNNGPCYVYYMAYYQGEKTGEEVFKHMQQRDGLLELVYVKGMDEPLPPSFGHIGISVPDIKLAEERFRKMGVEICKPSGRADKAGMCIPEKHWDTCPDLTAGFKKVFSEILMIRDPDGYYIEVVPYGVDKH